MTINIKRTETDRLDWQKLLVDPLKYEINGNPNALQEQEEVGKPPNKSKGGARAGGGRKPGSKDRVSGKRPSRAGVSGNFPGIATGQICHRIPKDTIKDFDVAMQVNGETRDRAVVLNELIKRYVSDSAIL